MSQIALAKRIQQGVFSCTASSMKAMVTHKAIKPNKKPSTMLGFLVVGVVFFTGMLLVWQIIAPHGSWGKLKAEHVLAVLGVSSAICGWLIAGIINLRNSIRQHTISTLLQSRLSATYMKYADDLSRHYEAFDRRRKENPALREVATDGVDVPSLRYILNYFEFIAIGVKRGDLEEEMLRDSLKSILKKNVAMSRPWIMQARIGNPRLYQNLLWLHDRWGD